MKKDKGKSSVSFSTLMRLLGYMLKHKVRLVIALVSMLVYSFMLVLLAGVMGIAINIIQDGGPFSSLQKVIGAFLLIALVFWLCGFLSQRLLSYISTSALYNLRTDLFEHIQEFSLDFFDRQPIGELMSRVTNDTDVIDQFLSAGFLQTVQSVMTITVITIAMVVVNPWLTLLVYLVIICQLAFSFIMAKVSGPAFESLQDRMAELNGLVEENLDGQKAIVAYRKQQSSEEQLESLSLKVRETGAKAQFAALVNQPAANFSYSVQVVFLMVFGGWMVVDGRLELGLVVSFLMMAALLSGPISQIFASLNQVISAVVGASSVFEMLDEKPGVTDIEGAPEIPPIEGVVDFKHVDFSYLPGRKIIKDNSFHVEPGQMIGLCGPTGAGKSTIINILTRYYDIDSGEIAVDGFRVNEVQQDSLRVQVALVLQEPFLFSETIMDNLKYGREGATDEECVSAARQANAHDFIMNQPGGYQAVLADGGKGLSQGQRQMITIARAVIANPRMLILDEATSSIDTRTEKLIQKGIMSLQEGRTSFFIAHRLSTITGADMILVINDGYIVEKGTHDELLKKDGLYRELYMNQFRGKLEAVIGG